MVRILVLALLPLLFANPLCAQGGAAGAVPEFAPPPVPSFMLKKPEKPLTLEEMQRQADEAARRARPAAPPMPAPPAPQALNPPPSPAKTGAGN